MDSLISSSIRHVALSMRACCSAERPNIASAEDEA
jgi:hypothetical protein